MDNLNIIISSVIFSLGYIIRRIIIEKGKVNRIEKLKELETSKINAIADYEKKSSVLESFLKNQKIEN